jgi:GT2 family glycosyltransferase
VSAIVPVFNETGGSLERTLRGLLGQAKPPDRLVVVDDGSSLPPSINDELATRIELIRLSENSGISEARNRGAQLETGEYLLFVNCDIVLRPDWLERGVEFMETNADAAAASGAIVPVVGPKLLRAWRLQFVETKAHRSALESPASVTWLVGHVLLIRRPVFEAIGGFDPRFRCAGEDWDISQRIRATGGSIFHLPDLIAESFETTSIDRLARKSLRNTGWDLRPDTDVLPACAAIHSVRPFATATSILLAWIDRSGRDIVKGRLSFLPVDAAVAVRSFVLAWRAWRHRVAAVGRTA